MNKEPAFGHWLNRIETGWKRYKERESRQSQEISCSCQRERSKLLAETLPVVHEPQGKIKRMEMG